MLFLNHLSTLDPISCRIWCGRLLCGLLPLIIDINEPSLQIKHAKHDKFYFVHTNEISHLNIQVVNLSSQKIHSMNEAWANSSRKSFTIGREPGAPHAPREELIIITLEEGSVEPSPGNPSDIGACELRSTLTWVAGSLADDWELNLWASRNNASLKLKYLKRWTWSLAL